MMGYIVLTSLTTGEQTFIGEGHVVKLPQIKWECDICKISQLPENGAFRKIGHPFEYWACNQCLEAGKEPPCM